MEEWECKKCKLQINGYCDGGVKCYGGEPIYPPCAEVDDFNDEEWLKMKQEDERRTLEREKIQREKEQVLQRRKQQREEYNRRNGAELWDIENHKKIIRAYRKEIVRIEARRSRCIAINTVNLMFESVGNKNHPENIDLKPIELLIAKIEEKILEQQNMIAELKTKIKENEKKYKLIARTNRGEVDEKYNRK